MNKCHATRQKLLDTALELIWSSSYGNVTVDDICKAGGISKSSFYHFFKGKSGLALAVYREQWEQSFPNYNRIFSAMVAPLARLSNFCAYIRAGIEESTERLGKCPGCPYSLIGMELSTIDEEIRLQVQTAFGRMVRYLEQTLRDAQHEGLIDPTLDPHQTAEDLYAYILGVLLQAKVQNDVTVLDRIEPRLMAMIGAKVPVA
ncbi:MAG: TetR/AcrR family transcriptional regulator [Aphanocapsa sp. GSE-SYN-MK-11-07L]|jgi:TetR/AcrR family transcriptional repressor of nem operon|nr:TetR/AcrR family transcriptional regulator [Aphanocapsa sp. GSE-SYN-MK-11-07L]